MVHVFATLIARPDTVEAARTLLRGLVAPSLAAAGCEHYQLFQSEQEPTRFQTVERWASREAWQAHLTSAYVAEAIAQAPNVFERVPVIQRFEEVG